MKSPLDILFPKRCFFCLARSQNPICDKCQRSLPWVTEQSGECFAPLYYRGSVRKMLHRYKFSGFLHYASLLGELMRMCLKDGGAAGFDLICWVPSAKRRIFRRGYDQSQRLAAELSERLSVPLAGLLAKTRHSKSQTRQKSIEERARNVAGAFRVKGGLKGERILLVDDIYTSGATLRECRGILLASGAGAVTCVCAAKKG